MKRARELWQRIAKAVSWTRPTSTEIATVAKSGLAAGVSWWVASVVTNIPDPVLAPLTALVVVQVSVRASLRTAIERSAAVVVGVLVAVAVGDVLGLNGLTVGLLVAVSLGVAELVLRFPAASARQVPISVLVVLSTVRPDRVSFGGIRLLDTVIGAAVGVIVSFALPASRLVDAHQTIERLGGSLGALLDAMGTGLMGPWSSNKPRSGDAKRARYAERLVAQAAEAVGQGRESARWNVRDRRHIDALGRFEEEMPQLGRAAIGVSVISRGLDDHARLDGTTHAAMSAMGALLTALADLIRAFAHELLGSADAADVAKALDEVHERRERCTRAASRRARLALDQDDTDDGDRAESEWLGYAALVVQVDRIASDLGPPPATGERILVSSAEIVTHLRKTPGADACSSFFGLARRTCRTRPEKSYGARRCTTSSCERRTRRPAESRPSRPSRRRPVATCSRI